MQPDKNDYDAVFKPAEVQCQVGEICGLKADDNPVVHWDTTPPASSPSIKEQFSDEGIDGLLGLYAKRDRSIRVFVERCRCFARAVGLQPDHVIANTLIHEMCHCVQDLGKGELENIWETFWNCDLNPSEGEVAKAEQMGDKKGLLEKLAEWNTLLVIRKDYPHLSPGFEEMQRLAPEIYRIGEKQRSKDDKAFRNILLKASGRTLVGRSDLLDFIE